MGNDQPKVISGVGGKVGLDILPAVSSVAYFGATDAKKALLRGRT